MNAATPPQDEFAGQFTTASVAGFTVTGDSLPAPLDAGESYDGLTITPNTGAFCNTTSMVKFGPTARRSPLRPKTSTAPD